MQRIIASDTKTYRYVLPTQLVAKLANPSLDCRALQAAYEGPGAFDARTVAHKVIVPFDRANHDVLGGSREPYVSNPLRVTGVLPSQAGAQKDQPGWSDLCEVLSAVEVRQEEAFTHSVFRQVLMEIWRRLANVRISYPVPIRVSLERTLSLLNEFLLQGSRGDRAQAVAGALFQLIGRRFGLFTSVRRGVTNAADAASGSVADLECVAEDGSIVLAVEVKDRQLTIGDIEGKLRSARTKQVAEVLFLAQKGIQASDEEVLALTEREFAGGQNVYLLDVEGLARVICALSGEGARPEMLRLIGEQLDEFRSNLTDRQAWRDLLARL